MSATTLQNQVHLKQLTVELDGKRLNLIVDSVTSFKLTLMIDGNEYIDKRPYPQGNGQLIKIILNDCFVQPIEIILDAELTKQQTFIQPVNNNISHRIIHCKVTNECYVQYVNDIYNKSQDCVICISEQPTELLECGHLCFCKACLQCQGSFCQMNHQVFKCPICRKYSRTSISLEQSLLTRLDQIELESQ